MKIKRKSFIAIVLCLALCATSAIYISSAATTVPEDPDASFLTIDDTDVKVDDSQPTEIGAVSLSYQVVDYSNITITGCETSLEGKYIIPSKISVSIRGNNYAIPVTKIGPHAFESCRDITSIEIPNSVKSIDKYAFNHCSRLVEVKIPDSVKSIGDYAFGSCINLKEIKIPTGVGAIEDRTFYACKKLETVSLPSTISRIGDYAFSACISLQTIDLPDSITKIDSWAFSDCIKLTEIKIPKAVKSISSRAFYDCSALTTVTIPDDGDFLGIGYETFYGCGELKSIAIPSSTVIIGYRAFTDGNEDLVVSSKGGSYVERFCNQTGIDFQAEGSMSWIVDRYKNRNFSIPNPEYTVNGLGLN
jgi:hypothetical protein